MSFQFPQNTGNPYGGTQQQQQYNYNTIQPAPTGFQQYQSQQPPTLGFQPENIIPDIQLSFITPQDQQKFKELFESSTTSISISPDAAKSILLKSNLSPSQLAKVWELSDLNKSGDLLFPEFALALHLCNMVLRGSELPYQLDQNLKNEVTNYVDQINFNAPEDSSMLVHPLRQRTISTSDIYESSTQAQQQYRGFNEQPYAPIQPVQTGYGFQTQSLPLQTSPIKNESKNPMDAYYNEQIHNSQPLGFQQTGLIQQQTGLMPIGNQGTVPTLSGGEPLQQQPTGFIPLQKTGNGTINPQPTGFIPLQKTGNGTLNPQPTGLIPLQKTGNGALNPQPTGLIPLQRTGNGALNPQPTGFIPLQKTGNGTLNPQPTGLIPLQKTGNGALNPQPTGLIPLQRTGNGALNPQPTGLIPIQRTGNGLISQKTGFGNFEPLRAQKTGFGQNSLFLTNLVPVGNINSNNLIANQNYIDQGMSEQEKQLFKKIFENYDVGRKGLLNADVCAEIFRKSGLNREELEKVWDLVARPNQTHLDRETFTIGMWLIYKKLNGFDLPEVLPEFLKPSSLRILDDVKTKLISSSGIKTIKKSSNSKLDGSRFKNDDDEIVISSSRHRRKNTSSKSTMVKEEHLSIEDLKKKIKEKKIILDAIIATNDDWTSKEQDFAKEDFSEIKKLKEQIKSLPNVSNTDNPELVSLKSRFNELSLKVPALIGDISKIENDITESKLQLFKIRNPSSIVGTGPNGEITNEDRKKAKSKALLATKMAKLMGKPLDDSVLLLTEEQNKLDEEYHKIQESNRASQLKIKDVEASIKEISNNLLKSFNSKSNNGEDYKKWELGIDVEPEVAELIKNLRVDSISATFERQSAPIAPAPAQGVGNYDPNTSSQNPPLPQSSIPAHNSTSLQSGALSHQTFKTPEERKAYIKEQARKKMQERLAKFGIRSPTPAASNNAPKLAPNPSLQVASPSTSAVNNESSDDSSDDDDEEDLKHMDEIIRMRKLERLRELKNSQR